MSNPTGTHRQATARDSGPVELSAAGITVGYGSRTIIDNLSTTIPTGSFTVIVGPNACGKSTLLKALSRMLPTTTGQVRLGGEDITRLKPKQVARTLALLPQAPVAPEGIIVEDLVARGRYPHQGTFHQWSQADQQAVDQALHRANVWDLKDRFVHELSGGQRQRVWVALVLAQQTPVVLLDEPTTYLDITHQVELLNLVQQLQREGTTVVAVLHELMLAFRYATHLIVMKDGAIVAEGPVEDVVTAEVIGRVYNLDCRLITDPTTGRPIVVPAPAVDQP
ncbi:ABC transporter ATP-binding protein [Corynebacterium mendelii]|uniref:ABC transporter ATP-binding protein n=1 Tax=Corynebacterium mendelii TaxID=2765362 RepID=A0A939E0W5_9CORY|nr:ABC transporter ATP-binding protein [Corynebacterium mendelii]MBN9644384.1 ABC transporter ATP-binding protein [Corynebacterium mendelii]